MCARDPSPSLYSQQFPDCTQTDGVILEDDEPDTPDPEAIAETSKQLIRLATDHGVISKTGAMLTITSVKFLRSSRKVWLRCPRPPKASLTLTTIPLGHHRTRSTNMVITEPWEAR
jgi:hypothetical protein